MRVAEPLGSTSLGSDTGTTEAVENSEWAEQTRQVLTRDLLVRASQVQRGEGRALQFRALHLNLPLVAEVAVRLGLTAGQQARVEHAALEGLHEALGLFDPYGEVEFAAFATPLIERQIRTRLSPRMISWRTPRPSRR